MNRLIRSVHRAVRRCHIIFFLGFYIGHLFLRKKVNLVITRLIQRYHGCQGNSENFISGGGCSESDKCCALQILVVGQDDFLAAEEGSLEEDESTTESFQSFDDYRWLYPGEESGPPLKHEIKSCDLQLGCIRQPTPPPIQAQVQTKLLPVYRDSGARLTSMGTSDSGLSGSRSYQDVHIPVKMMEDFLKLARKNTAKDLETCGVLAGSLRNKVFHITTLIIPKQESTSNSCQTLNEEDIFYVQDSRSMFTLGWIHTHPTQTCFMSSVDLHTQYSYQVMLPEAIAIVMAPTDTLSPHGIFRLTDPGGIGLIRNCERRGFHPHEDLEDGNPIYERCSHVYIDPDLEFDVVDLR